MRESYQLPKSDSKPILREINPEAKVNYADPISNRYLSNERSGYVENTRKFDGDGLKFHKGWDASERTTEYRQLYNPTKPFHNTNGRVSPTSMRKSIAGFLPFEIIGHKTVKYKFN